MFCFILKQHIKINLRLINNEIQAIIVILEITTLITHFVSHLYIKIYICTVREIQVHYWSKHYDQMRNS